MPSKRYSKKETHLRKLLRNHMMRVYWEDVDGSIGVINHANSMLWYELINGAGYSLVNETKHIPKTAKKKHIGE